MADSLRPSLLTRPPDASQDSSMGPGMLNMDADNYEMESEGPIIEDTLLSQAKNNNLDASLNEYTSLESNIPCGQISRIDATPPAFLTSSTNSSSSLQDFTLPGLDDLERPINAIEQSIQVIQQYSQQENHQQENQYQETPRNLRRSTVNNHTLQSSGARSVILIQAIDENEGKQLIKNPMKINQAIKQSLFNSMDINDIRMNNKRGLIAVEMKNTLTQHQVQALTEIGMFANIQVKCYLPNSDSYVSGVISPIDLNTDLQQLAHEIEITDGSKIHSITRLKKKINNNWEDSLSLKITFLTNKCPSHISIHHIRYQVRPYVANPMQCYRCQRLGHTTKSCKATYQRCMICGGPHDRGQCNNVNNIQCANCKKDHPANSRSCQYLKDAIEIEKIKATRQTNYENARRIYSTRKESNIINTLPNEQDKRESQYHRHPTSQNATYSQIVRTQSTPITYMTTRDNSTQTENNEVNQLQQPKVDTNFFINLRNLIVELLTSRPYSDTNKDQYSKTNNAMKEHFGINLQEKETNQYQEYGTRQQQENGTYQLQENETLHHQNNETQYQENETQQRQEIEIQQHQENETHQTHKQLPTRQESNPAFSKRRCSSKPKSDTEEDISNTMQSEEETNFIWETIEKRQVKKVINNTDQTANKGSRRSKRRKQN